MTRLEAAETRAAWLFLAPSLFLFVMFVALPVLAAFGISFTNWDLFTAPHFTGFQNYGDLIFHDVLFHKVLVNTLLYVGGTVPLQMLLALGIFVLSQLAVIGLGCLPKESWASFRDHRLRAS